MTHLEVMNLWDSPQALAADLGVKLGRVQKWRVRRKIPPKAWPAVITAAKGRGLQVNADILLTASTRPALSSVRHVA